MSDAVASGPIAEAAGSRLRLLLAGEGGYDLQPYPHVRDWLARMQALPGYVPLL